MSLERDLRNHAIQLRTKIEEFPDQQGVEITAYLVRRTIKLLELAASRLAAA